MFYQDQFWHINHHPSYSLIWVKMTERSSNRRKCKQHVLNHEYAEEIKGRVHGALNTGNKLLDNSLQKENLKCKSTKYCSSNGTWISSEVQHFVLLHFKLIFCGRLMFRIKHLLIHTDTSCAHCNMCIARSRCGQKKNTCLRMVVYPSQVGRF